MSLPRWSPNRVRADAAPDLVTSRGLDSLQPTLAKYADEIETGSGVLSDILSKIKKMAYPVLRGFYLTTGSNQRFEDAVLVAGSKVVGNTSVTASTRFMPSRQALGGAAGHLSVVGNPGVGYTITSSSGTDTSTVTVMLVERI